MKYLLILFVITISLSRILFGNGSPHWNLSGENEGWKDEFLAIKYFHNSELQRQWGWHLLGCYHFSGNEHILDFGCGEGKITAEVSHFIPQGKILGVDLSSSMIKFAERCFPNTHYPNLSFTKTADPNFSDPYNEEKYDLIYSLCVFHVVPNPVEVLSNLRLRLAVDGKLLLVIPAGNNPAFFQAASEIFDKYGLQAPWASEEKATHATMRTQEGCIYCLKAAGFKPISLVMLHTPTSYFNRQELVEWMIGTMTANWQIPLEIADPFFNAVVDRMAELDGDVIDQSGAYNMKLSRIEVVAQPINEIH
jgi:trans-aconitate 2-methyltransferase